MQFNQDGTEFCQLIYADYLDDNGSMLADDVRLDATDPQMNESDWHWEYRNSGVGGSRDNVGSRDGGVGGRVGGRVGVGGVGSGGSGVGGSGVGGGGVLL